MKYEEIIWFMINLLENSGKISMNFWSECTSVESFSIVNH